MTREFTFNEDVLRDYGVGDLCLSEFRAAVPGGEIAVNLFNTRELLIKMAGLGLQKHFRWVYEKFIGDVIRGIDLSYIWCGEGAKFPNMELCDLTGVCAPDAVFKDIDFCMFSNARLRNADMHDSNAAETVFRGADLTGALIGGNFNRADFSMADLRDAAILNADANQAIFDRVRMSNATVEGSSLRRAFFRAADLQHSKFSVSDMYGAVMTGANIYGTRFTLGRKLFPDLSGTIRGGR